MKTRYYHLPRLTGVDAPRPDEREGPAPGPREVLVRMRGWSLDYLTNRAIEPHRPRPVVDRAFPFAEAGEAYRYFASRGHFGKVVITDE
ncbi:zinc-binding dehydrogenase [Streptomyces sp. NPDC005322]|uniref:zinc-binding dehydrogenase n=1 Tax=Streptomyces sp. NPDC005322 TaxID=3157032 RepID=UPI0033ACDC4E